MNKEDVKIGVRVRLKAGGALFVSSMTKYLGQVVAIKELFKLGTRFVKVVGNNYLWDTGALELVEEDDTPQLIQNDDYVAVKRIDGATCNKCGDRNEYVPANPQYVCAICKGWQKAFG